MIEPKIVDMLTEYGVKCDDEGCEMVVTEYFVVEKESFLTWLEQLEEFLRKR